MEASEGVTVENFVKDDIQEVAVRTHILYDYAIAHDMKLDEEKEAELITQATSVFESYDPEIVAKYGFTLDQLKDTIVKQGYSELVFDELTKDYVLDPDEVQAKMEENAVYQNMMTYGTDAFYDKVRARHILIKTVDDANEAYSTEDYAAARTKTEGILERAKNGEDFAALATEFTEDPGSVETGGEYTFGRGEMVPEFEAAAYGLEIGGISDIVETQYGFHIIKLEERIASTDEEKEQAKLELASIQEEAEYSLRVTEFDKIYATILEDYNVVVDEDVWATLTFRDETVAE
jgi:parvulin-like peptidyl-prolyl isomerase